MQTSNPTHLNQHLQHAHQGHHHAAGQQPMTQPVSTSVLSAAPRSAPAASASSSSGSSRSDMMQQQVQQQQQQQQQQVAQMSSQQAQRNRHDAQQVNVNQRHSQQQQPQQQQQQQQQQAAALAQLLAGSNPSIPATMSNSVMQQHATILSDARSNVSGFAAAMQEAKHSCPTDRPDIRTLIATLERASKSLSSELGRSINKLKALNDSQLTQQLNSTNQLFPPSSNAAPSQQQQNADLSSALASLGLPAGLIQSSNLGVPGQGMQQDQQQTQANQASPFDFSFLMQQDGTTNPASSQGASNSNQLLNFGAPFGLPFPTDPQSLAPGQQQQQQGQQGSQQANAFFPALAQYLSQGQDASRLGGLNSFQGLLGASNMPPHGQAQNPLDLLLASQRQQPQQTGSAGSLAGLDLGNPTALNSALLNGANFGGANANPATLAALAQLGFTPSMLEVLALGSNLTNGLGGMQTPGATSGFGAPQQAAQSSPFGGASLGVNQAGGVDTQSAGAKTGDVSPAGTTTPTSEPSRKRRKHGRSKLGETPPTSVPASVSAAPALSLSLPMPGQVQMSMAPSLTPPLATTQAPHPTGLPLPPGMSVPQTGEKRIATLGVGLRQEGDKRYRNRKLLRDLREHLYRWLGTNEFRKLKNTYKVAEWVPNPNLTEEEKAAAAVGSSSAPPITTHIFHVDFTSRDFYRTNQALIDAIVNEGSKKVEARPEAYGIIPGTIDRDHLEDVAKDLMDSARSGFRMSLRTGVQAEREDKEKHEKYRGVERAKTKCRNREIGAARLRHEIPRQLLIPGAYSDDAASDEDLHGLTKSEWKRQRLRKLRIAKGWEAVAPKWRNRHLTKAYHKADIVSKSKQMARWRRDSPVDLPFPVKLYGKTLPAALFDADWLAQHRAELEDEPYFVKIDDTPVQGWNETDHPLGEDTSDEMEWSDAKESNSRARRHESKPEAPTSSATAAAAGVAKAESVEPKREAGEATGAAGAGAGAADKRATSEEVGASSTSAGNEQGSSRGSTSSGSSTSDAEVS